VIMPKPASPHFISTLGRTIEEGMSLQRQGRLNEAEKIYARVLKTLPDQFETLQLLAEIKLQRAKPGEALRLMTAAVAARPDSVDAHVHLGHVLRALKRDGDSLASYERALAIDPDNVEALGNRGDIFLAQQRPADALACFERILHILPTHHPAQANRGVALGMLARYEEALAEFVAVAEVAPSPMTFFNQGRTLAALGRHAEAVATFDQALAIDTDHLSAWNGRGLSLHALNRHAEAITSFDRALAIDPENADAHFNKALALLAIGHYLKGFSEYEWRWNRRGFERLRHNFNRPLWRGEYPLQHRTILLHAEQGLGDTIQFIRYAIALAGSGVKAILEVHQELKPLISRLEAFQAVIALGEARPAYDVHCPLGTLPMVYKTEPETVPAEIPYLSASTDRTNRWRPRLEARSGLRIGLVWAGNVAHPNDRNRSIPLATLCSLWSAEVCFIGLQRDLRAGDADILASSPVLHLGGELADFDDTAALLALCDLVISVDTSVAHLAAAMGRPVWILLPHFSDWRWTAAAVSTPWYPAARLFRQPQPGDWDSVIGSVMNDLIARTSGSSQRPF
jgi:tetratricopeptide (TPR) repeat protein